MQSRIFKLLALFTAVFVIFGGFHSNEAQAKTISKKKVVATSKQTKKAIVKSALTKPSVAQELIADPVSKCLTRQIKNLNAQAVKQMEADVAKRGKGHDKAVADYKYRINMAWEAMSLPYCGYGSKTSLADEVHSFKKSIDRARDGFLSSSK